MSTHTAPLPLEMDDITALRHYAATRDPRAFEAIVHRYQGMVLAACERTTRSRADAEDAAQETFLKLARGAGAIRSNATAWLHACAVRTSIDLVRKRGSASRAEQSASIGDPTAEAAPGWQEIKPILDDALAELDEGDRELIIVRFLAGRSEADMAREARCSPGTMNRRIDRALDRLRSALSSRGLCVAGSGALAGVMGMAIARTPPTELTRSLMEIGLANLAAPSTVAVAGGAKSTVFIAGSVSVLAGLMVGTGALGLLGGSPPPAAPMASAPVVLRAERVKSAEGPQRLLSAQVEAWPHSTMTCEGSLLTVNLPAEDGGTSMDVMKIRIESVSGGAKNAQFQARFESFTTVSGKREGMRELVGQTWKGECRIVGDRLEMLLTDSKSPPTQMRWTGVRSATPAKERDPASAPAPLPELVGVWDELPTWTLTMSADQITVKGGDHEVMRLRIEEWTPGDDFAKVRVFAARYMNAELIGSRFGMLVRKTTDGYTLAVPNSRSAKLDGFPAGFEPQRGSHIAILRFGKEGK